MFPTSDSAFDYHNLVRPRIDNAVIRGIFEPTTVDASTVATGTLAYYMKRQSVWLLTTAATGNWTLNLTWNLGITLDSVMAVGSTTTVCLMATQGGSPFYNNALQIDGAAVTQKYQGGTAWSAGNASGIDVYAYVIVKTAPATYTVLASQTQFK